MASQDGVGALAPRQGELSYITFATPRSGKVTESDMSCFASGIFNPGGGGSITATNTTLTERDVDGSIILKEAVFSAEAGAVSHAVRVEMTPYWGRTVEDVLVALAPAGESFTPEATLRISLHGALTDDMFSGMAYHVHDDGVVEEIGISIEKVRTDGVDSLWIISMRVPGFSRYELGAGT